MKASVLLLCGSVLFSGCVMKSKYEALENKLAKVRQDYDEQLEKKGAKIKALDEIIAKRKAQIKKLDQKIAELQAMRKTLMHLISNCAGDDRPDCPILSELSGEKIR